MGRFLLVNEDDDRAASWELWQRCLALRAAKVKLKGLIAANVARAQERLLAVRQA
jgi:hypothetical protein